MGWNYALIESLGVPCFVDYPSTHQPYCPLTADKRRVRLAVCLSQDCLYWPETDGIGVANDFEDRRNMVAARLNLSVVEHFNQSDTH